MAIFGDSKVFCNINRFMAEVYLGCALNLLLGTRSETNEKAKKYDYRGSGAANLTKWLILTPEFPGLNPHPQMLLSIYLRPTVSGKDVDIVGTRSQISFIKHK